MINRNRLVQEFLRLVRIDSTSGKEAAIAEYLKQVFTGMDAHIFEDGAGKAAGSNANNLIVRMPGKAAGLPPLMFNAHLDTVEPGTDINVVETDGILKSDGRTILGADDKSGIAILIEVLRVLKESNTTCAPIELVFTISEETGLWGAKYLDYGLLESRMGYALDTSSVTRIISGAPEANTLSIRINGLAAHAGLEPEKGINAIQLAGEALAQMQLGRIDYETTANIGLISGGTARNIVPEQVFLKGEVRSHNKDKLDRQTAQIRDCLDRTISNYRAERKIEGDLPSWTMDVDLDYPLMKVPDDHPAVSLAREAGRSLERELVPEKSGGGSDANVFNAHGITTVILGTGMQMVHTTNEFIKIDDMVQAAELILKMILLYSEEVGSQGVCRT
ncbi:MAG: M20/M25/M40 family metallo-hydrolase [Pseudomonadota bacterium]